MFVTFHWVFWVACGASERNSLAQCPLQHSSLVRQLHAHEGATRASCLLSTNASQPQIKNNMHASTYIWEQMHAITYLLYKHSQIFAVEMGGGENGTDYTCRSSWSFPDFIFRPNPRFKKEPGLTVKTLKLKRLAALIMKMMYMVQ